MLRPVFYLTDFGTRDPYIGIMKAIVTGFHPQIPQYDLTHETAPQSVQSGIIALQDSWPSIPQNSIICAVVDPGVGSTRDPLLIQWNDRIIIAPDNGLGFFEQHFLNDNTTEAWKIDIQNLKLLEQIAQNSRPSSLNDLSTFRSFITGELEEKSGAENKLPDISNTFHGRDIFAPAAACASLGIEELIKNSVVQNPVTVDLPEPNISTDGIVAQIISVDHFGNLATNVRMNKLDVGIKEKIFSGSLKFKNRQVIKHGKTFSAVNSGEAVFYESSFNRLEVAVRNGNAAEVLGLKLGDGLEIEFP